MKKTEKQISRRSFIGGAVTATAGFMVIPSRAVSGLGHTPPGNKLNIAGIGIGGYGYNNLKNLESENIVALCDVDWAYAGNAFKRWPRAKQYKDFRIMLDQQKDIDAIVIATPDHTHALAAMSAIRAGKHVFLQQPMAHSVYESRILRDAGKIYGVATQQGNQGSSGDGIRRICEWIWAGTIGEVTHVDAWSTRPIWPQNMPLPERGKRVPRDLDWDLFIGPASWREYHPDYHPWSWRGWWDFGSGALGDMGIHILDPAFQALMLNHPVSVQANSSEYHRDALPQSEFIRFEFPRRDNLPKAGMPEVSLHWYDGGWMPPRPDELNDGEKMGDESGGCIFHGTRGKIMCGTYGMNPTLLPTKEMEHFQEPARSIRRISQPFEGGHEQEWVRACKEPRENRLEATANFENSGRLSELIALGNLAVRVQSLHRKLSWDGPNMRFTNVHASDILQIPVKNTFELNYGNPRLKREAMESQAQESIEAWIRPTYRQGWEQI